MSASAQREKTFQDLLENHGPAIQRLCRGYERAPALSAELEQEILFALWRSLEHFRGDASLRTWTFRVAHNVAASHIARRKRDRSTPSELPTSDQTPDSERNRPEAQLNQAERLHRLQTAILRLKPADRQLMLLYLEDLPQPEIADIIGLSRDNVSTRIHRVKQRLAELMRGRSP